MPRQACREGVSEKEPPDQYGALSSRGGRGQVLLQSPQPAPPAGSSHPGPYQTLCDKDNLLGSAFLLSPMALRAAREDLGRVAQAGTKGTLGAHR